MGMVFHSPIPSLPMCLLSLSPKRQQTGQVLFGVAAHRTAADDVLGLGEGLKLLVGMRNGLIWGDVSGIVWGFLGIWLMSGVLIFWGYG